MVTTIVMTLSGMYPVFVTISSLPMLLFLSELFAHYYRRREMSGTRHISKHSKASLEEKDDRFSHSRTMTIEVADKSGRNIGIKMKISKSVNLF